MRRTAQLSLSRTGKTPSKPGKPPRKVMGDLRDNIVFAYDTKDTVVVGPTKLNLVALSVGRSGGLEKTSGNVPALHEFGGRQGIIEAYWGAKYGWVRADLRRTRRAEKYRVRVAKYPARPYMNPALVKNAPKFPKLFINSIK